MSRIDGKKTQHTHTAVVMQYKIGVSMVLCGIIMHWSHRLRVWNQWQMSFSIGWNIRVLGNQNFHFWHLDTLGNENLHSWYSFGDKHERPDG